jgi:mediator of RNA polymerase II transcription subunit 8
MIPDYLRTKPEPEVEQKEAQLYVRASQISADAGQKQITTVNKIANNIMDLIKTSREEWDQESGQRSLSQTSSINDTNTIIAAIASGKGLKGPVPVSGSPKPGAQPPGSQPLAGQPPGPKMGGPGKAPALKTNIKSASAHPYAR